MTLENKSERDMEATPMITNTDNDYASAEDTEVSTNSDENDAILRQTLQKLRRTKIFLWLFVIISCLQAAWIFIELMQGQSSACPDVAAGPDPRIRTEFASAHAAVEQSYEERRFAGNWVPDEERNFVMRSVDLTKPQYFGDPHEIYGIEENWKSLLEVEFVALNDQEASLWPNLTTVAGLPDKYMELDVTHTLHCVNHLRKMLYASYYNQTGHSHHINVAGDPPGFYLEHMDHCLEQLFQSTMCHSDLTPAPLYSFAPGRRATFAVGQTHMCRSFESVREWLYSRARERPSVNSEGNIYRFDEES